MSIKKRYYSNLSKKDKKKQLISLKKSRKNYKTKKGKKKYYIRPKLKSFKEKESSWTKKFHKLYPKLLKIKDIAEAVKIDKKALVAVKKKGMGAYYSSGSRPNQTAESWGLARMYSYILGGKTRIYDKHITDKYNVKFIYPNKF